MLMDEKTSGLSTSGVIPYASQGDVPTDLVGNQKARAHFALAGKMESGLSTGGVSPTGFQQRTSDRPG